MTGLDIVKMRLHNQRIAGIGLEKPADVVRWMGAVQAQDYGAAKWAVGLRMVDGSDEVVEQAVASGAIVRTHVMRPTWHFVAPEDIRWLLALTAPRVNAASAYQYRQLGLDDALFKRSNAVLAKALEGGKHLTRAELAEALRQGGFEAESLGFTYMVMRAELDAVICSGARRGKQYTYALLDERVPQARVLERDEALAEITGRYFRSHGPATLQDFVWWSGLTVADAKAGLEMVKSQFLSEALGGRSYWFSEQMPPARDVLPTTYLLPDFDEYTVGYTDRSAIVDASQIERFDSPIAVLLNNVIVVNGQVVGSWKRTINKGEVVVETAQFSPLGEANTKDLKEAAERYGRFIGLPTGLLSRAETRSD